MGLDTTHDCWHGPYSEFGRWRAALCEAAGLGNLADYVGYEPLMPREGRRERTPGLEKPLTFDASDPLTVLFAHSDCDGSIASADCGPLADRLEALLPEVRHRWAEATQQFIDGLRAAAEEGEGVEFH